MPLGSSHRPPQPRRTGCHASRRPRHRGSSAGMPRSTEVGAQDGQEFQPSQTGAQARRAASGAPQNGPQRAKTLPRTRQCTQQRGSTPGSWGTPAAPSEHLLHAWSTSSTPSGTDLTPRRGKPFFTRPCSPAPACVPRANRRTARSTAPARARPSPSANADSFVTVAPGVPSTLKRARAQPDGSRVVDSHSHRSRRRSKQHASRSPSLRNS